MGITYCIQIKIKTYVAYFVSLGTLKTVSLSVMNQERQSPCVLNVKVEDRPSLDVSPAFGEDHDPKLKLGQLVLPTSIKRQAKVIVCSNANAFTQSNFPALADYRQSSSNLIESPRL